MAPARLTLPKVGRRPVTPQRVLGETIEPQVSVPRANGTRPAATAAAEPPCRVCRNASPPVSTRATRRRSPAAAAALWRYVEAVAATPDPDSALVSLGQVSDTLGGKGVLW